MKCGNQNFFLPRAYIERNRKVQKTNVCAKILKREKTQSLDSRGLELQTKVLKCKGLVEFY
jgi:hypothetical protein